MKKEFQTEDDRIIEGCKNSIKKLDEEKERIYEMTKNLTEIIGRMENIKKDKEQSKEDYLKENRRFEKLYELIKYATEMNWRLIEGGKVKPFTPESASQKRGFEDSTVILEEEKDKELDRGRDYDFHGLIANHPDKPCRMMRERLHLKNNLCGDLPAFAPKGKCYFDHQKDCNAWCSFWEGNEDDEGVKNIREIQKNIANCSLPRYKIVEDKK